MIRLHIILLFLLDKTLAAIMTAVSFALVPSQVPGARSYFTRTAGSQKEDDNSSTVMKHSNAADNSDSDSAGDQVVYNPPQIAEEVASVASSSSTTPSKRRSLKKKRFSTPRTGNLPDIHWRAISMSHLRSHPNFQPLPPPSMINSLPTKEHVRYFRQDSWQWDHLHTGRCTTSQCSAALGFLEPKSASFLGIPKSLQRGGVGAWNRLSETVPEDEQSLYAMEQILCEGRSSMSSNDDDSDMEDIVKTWRPGAKESDRLWIPASRLASAYPYPFSAKYIPTLTYEELCQRKLYMQQYHVTPSPMKVRMQWGNAQEATSILTALNYFCGRDNRTVIKEVGMCGASFDDEIELDNIMQGIKIGASPDAIIHHGDGSVEVLEVKNHCPFVWNREYTKVSGAKIKSQSSSKHKKKQKGRKKQKKSTKEDDHDDHHKHSDNKIPKHYLIRDFQLERRIPEVYVPQLMMEMMCVGPNCTSAIMVRQTATKGAILLRIKRCEPWIQEMRYWLGRFQSEFVKTGKVPEDNFFWDNDPNSRYHKFLQMTKELSESVEQVAFVNHGRIQRMMMEGEGGEIPLFLDKVEARAEEK